MLGERSCEGSRIAAPDRTPLNADRIFAAALELIDEHGVESLSMRRLAACLGVEAASLYEHVAGKEVLLDGVCEALLAEFTLARRRGDWRARLRQIAFAWAELAETHPRAFRLLYRPQRRIAGGDLPVMEEIVAALEHGGFSGRRAALALRTYTAFVDGALLRLATRASPPTRSWRDAEPPPTDEFPHYAAVSPLAARLDDRLVFAAGVDVVIDGLAALLRR
ncbi:MAG TPA: TetR family transcriptional regulator [Gaiellaceae bacterium]|nr:TetR family transcriptional regulator [Gaiellaceae bacterium]